MFGYSIKDRELLIIDECHTVESEVGKFIDIVFSEKFAIDFLSCKLPRIPKDETKIDTIVFKWIKNTYFAALCKATNNLLIMMASSAENANVEALKLYGKRHDMLEKHITKINSFIKSYESNKQNWVLNISQIDNGKKSYRKFEFKTIHIAEYAKKHLYDHAKKVLMLSATVINKEIFCNSIGIKSTDVAYMFKQSPFPIENRPIHYFPVGKMSMKEINNTLPALKNAIEFILEQHKDEKGMIHCVSFKIANYIKNNIKNDRLLIHDDTNREKTLAQHVSSKEPTVLLSPSMMEGVDLSNDLSRFQIICKVPFPYLGDKVIRRRMELDSQWYNMQTIKSLVQAVGRSVRNNEDYAVTYILDQDWSFFFNKNKQIMPRDFVSAVQ
jgi:Rad3-related DNA helicase